MHSSRRKSIGVFVAIAAIIIISLTCAGAAAQDEDWLGPGGAAPTYEGEIYHMGPVGIDTEEPNAKLHVADHLTDANHPSILIEKASTIEVSPRLGMVDTNYITGGPYPVEDCPMWSIDNFRDQFRIYRQPDKNTMGEANQSLLINNEFEVGIGTDSPTERLDVGGKVRVRDLPEGNDLTDIVVADADGVLHVRDADTLGGGGGEADTDWLPLSAGNTGNIYHASGKVGIGTNDPATNLDVHGDITVRGYIFSGTAGLGTAQPLRLFGAGPLLFVADYNNDDLSSSFNWYINGESEANMKMTLTEQGNLGIGDSTPDAKLEVTGSVALATESSNAVCIGNDPGIGPTNADLRILSQGWVYAFAVGNHDNTLNYFTVTPYASQARSTVNINDVLHLTPRSEAPTVPPPSQGDIYVNTSGHIYCYLGTAWRQLDNN